MRPSWFPPLMDDTESAMAEAILLCQGDWWTSGGSVCRKPELCVVERACYFVARMDRAMSLGLPTLAPGVAINPHARIETCRSCGQPIWWGRTAKGRTNPYDVHDAERAAISHFSTCPDAARWSKRAAPERVPVAPRIEWHPGYDGYRWVL